jgi:hypothetical protein
MAVSLAAVLESRGRARRRPGRRVLGRGTGEFLGALLMVALLGACDYEASSGRAESETSKVRNRPGDAPAAGGQRQARDGKQRRDRRDDTQRGRARMAVAALARLPVKGRAPMTGYMREAFGQEWLDADRNGCDTRIICTLGFAPGHESGVPPGANDRTSVRPIGP